ncbi:CapA family protein [Pseudonocardia sp. KRD-184]|uniref:CapA family protein n=1 Tax=Pseudonocardia oceani TaxID=2792013 RepID=A0ABS6U4D0_9PSEU|nr:CapA family protein [Pseudonocardia oceani]MBW0093852.1 CapA family protein [Pseudonocardia oceani]MBW0100441.1 CapA family protein [Pseudonocardia oceani]MBW0127068.1 CapA family protein [Pseudonocardia oceani]
MGTTTIALTGNTFIAQSVRRNAHPRFLQTVDLLRAADVTLANLECTIPDPDTPPAFVAGHGWAATYMAGTPDMLDDLRFMGIDAVCAANNHVSDFGDAGVLSTVQALRAAGLPFTGIGASLTEATQPGYIDTPAGLRVAFVAACDWGPRGALGLGFPWPMGVLASDEQPPFRSRPGLNLLRYSAVAHVTRAQLENLRTMSRELGWEQDKTYRRLGFWRSHPLVGSASNLDVEQDTEDQVWFLGRKFVVDDAPGQHTEPCAEDLDRLFKAVREARRQADIVLVGLHDQSHGEDGVHGYVSAFSHGAIDAGADVFFNNGASFGGVEIYRDKPILHGLPGLFLQTEAVREIPLSQRLRYGLDADSTAADYLDIRSRRARQAFAEGGPLGARLQGAGGSAVHLCVFDDLARLREIRVQPVEPLGGTQFSDDAATPTPRFRKQLPLLAERGSDVEERVLAHAAGESAALGTETTVEDGQLVIRFA